MDKIESFICIIVIISISSILIWMVYDATYNRPNDFSDYWVTDIKYGTTKTYGDYTEIGLANGSGILYELSRVSMPNGIRVIGHYDLEIGAYYSIFLGPSIFGEQIISGDEPNAYTVVSITKVG